MKHKVEILAPAGSFGSMQASFKAGADAVYMGGQRFGARAYAENPDDGQLIKAIDYAHLRGKRLYLTVNTVVKERELSDLFEYLRPLYLHGLDAVIVQDLGVLNMVTRCFPDLPVHISTQMSLTTAEATEFLDSNVTRIVPARELTLDEIASIKKGSGLELEVFVHGALCYSYSGQCLLSSAFGERSGNRGRCAQPCRKQYTVNGGKSYLLSPKDICTLRRIPDLIEAGVDSFKIEGRMKSPMYACGVSAIYRKAVDLYERLGREGYYNYLDSHEDVFHKWTTDLADLFNRGGFSEGYAFEKTGSSMMSVHRPNHEGVYVGNAVIRKGYAELKTVETLFPGDVLEIRDNRCKDWYSYTTPVEYNKNTSLRFKACPSKAEKSEGLNVQVFRLRREQLIRDLTEKYIEVKDYIPVNGTLYLTPGTDIIMFIETAEDNALTGKKHSVTVSGEMVNKAKQAPLSEKTILDKVTRSGDSDFEFRDVHAELTDECFLPKSALGAIRRDAFLELEKEILGGFRRSPERVKTYTECNKKNQTAAVQNMPEINCVTTSVEQLKTCIYHRYASIITIDLETEAGTWFLNNSDALCEDIRKTGKKLYIRTWHIADEKNNYLLAKIIKELEGKIDTYIVRNLSHAAIIRNQIWDLACTKINADKNLYCANHETKEWLMAHGFSGYTYPAELSCNEMKAVNDNIFQNTVNMETELCVYGREELMVSKQCIKNSRKQCNGKPEWVYMTSAEGDVFPVYTDCKSCRNRIYSSKPVDLRYETVRINELEPDIIRLTFTDEGAEQTDKLLNNFHDAFSTQKIIDELSNFDEKGRKRGKTGETGHFNRPVL